MWVVEARGGQDGDFKIIKEEGIMQSAKLWSQNWL